VLATLLDDVMFQLNESGGATEDTEDVIEFILGKQTVARWTLDTCDFTRLFEYKWENENLLNALFSIPKPFNSDYQWTWDTSVYPWELSLIDPSSDIDARIMYRKNLIGIEKETDPTQLITRLYGLGYGEGVNQLTIKAVNSGVAYIDASTIGTYGVIAKIFADKRYESADSLMGAMESILEQHKTPKTTYTVKAADLYKISNDSLDKFVLGNLVQVDDSETGFSFSARVVSISKNNISENPGNIELQLSNKVEDINNSISNLEVKASVVETYSQGATNIDSHEYQDNCDNTHAAIVKFYVSDEVVRMNKCMLNYSVDYFRSYGAATKGGGGTTVTSASGGGTTVTSADGGGSTETTVITVKLGSFLQNMGTAAVDYATTPTQDDNFLSHSHSVTDHEHSVTVPDHSHSVTIADHSHSVTIPDHTHDIDHGIYEFGYLPPSVTVKVDGNTVTGVTGLTGSDIDIISYLDKTSGKVNRGEFHTVQIIPSTNTNNPKGLARIYANVTKQVFIKSTGGGDY
jgi:phage minor structural protein